MLSKYSADLLREGYSIKGKRHTRKGEEITILKSEINDSSSHQLLTEEINISKYIGEKMRRVRRKIEETNRNIEKGLKKDSSNLTSSSHRGHFSLPGEGEVSGEEGEIVPVYVTKATSQFVGIDGRIYGPLRPDQVASMPALHAKNLADTNHCRILRSK